MTDQPLLDSHPNHDACLALIGHRVKARHPKFPDRIVKGIVIAYDPQPFLQLTGDWLVIKPDKVKNDVCHPPYIIVRFDLLITGADQGSPTAEEMNQKRRVVL